MNIKIEPQRLCGTVTPPPSKSESHRLIITAALCPGESTIHNVAFSQDIEATLRCVNAMGGRWERAGDSSLVVHGIVQRAAAFDKLPVYDCGESGSTLRFFIPIALALTGGGVFIGSRRLMERPQQPYFALFDEKGIAYEQSENTLMVLGHLSSGKYSLPGNVSSQFFTGLLLALSLMDGDSVLESTTDIQSQGYITMTIDSMRCAGADITELPNGRSYYIHPRELSAFERRVEPDWSQAGFWYAAGFLGSDILIEGLNEKSSQGDAVISRLSERLSASGDTELDVSGCPDLLPPLAVMAAVRKGTTHFVNAARLRIKESDRLNGVCGLITALGGRALEQNDGLTVFGQPQLEGGTVNGCNDHRIVMAAAIAACACTSAVTIFGAEAVRKSYPSFFDDYSKLGGKAYVI